MQTQISLKTFLNVLRNSWIKIFIIVLVVSAGVGIYSNFYINKIYSSSVKYYVLNQAMTSDYSTATLTSGAQALAYDYIEILTNDPMVDKVLEELETKYSITSYTRGQIKGMLSTTIHANTSTFSLKVSNLNKEHAKIIADCYSEYANKILYGILKSTPLYDNNGSILNIERTQCVMVISEPVLAKSSDTQSSFRGVFLAAAASGFLSYCLFFIITLSDTVIKEPEDVKNSVACTLIGVIPAWEKKSS